MFEIAMILFVTVFIFLFGLIIGSFLNVLIYRLPLGLMLTGRSFCPKCKKKISWFDNVPLLSFFVLGGKCRFCHSPINFQYPAVELTTGVLFVFVLSIYSWQNFQLWSILGFVYTLWLVSALLVIFVIDLKHRIIPDEIVFATILISLPFAIRDTPYALLTAFASFLFFFLLHFLTRGKGMGLGDVKLAFLIGLILGFPKSILAFYLAFLTGAIVGVILVLLGKKKLKQAIAFGPFLVASTFFSLFWGDALIRWLTKFF